MKHAVITLDKQGKAISTNQYKTAETAYREYVNNIRIIRNHIQKGEEFTILRLNGCNVMTSEKLIAN